MPAACNRLFVYGTLMSGFDNPMSRRLQRESRLLGKAYAHGILFNLDGYPGAILVPDGSNKIHGELYELLDADKSFVWLDEYEDGGPDNHPGYLYRRHQTGVFFQNKKIMAWMYEYIQSTENLSRIESGDYSTDSIQNRKSHGR
jgi:gamma-glutamylcyclotransferase (GGCT)/AIG2-like uncharacterized protein YtfP